ncbi:MAG: ATP-dependent DNA helicase [Ornithinimicrobium sp.]
MVPKLCGEDLLSDATRGGPTVISARQIAATLGTPPPTDEQIAIIEAPLESMLVVAGAGSGKTETMASRVLWLVVNDHVRPDEVLGLTFTRKASIELATRLAHKLRALRSSGLWEVTEEASSGAASEAVLAPTVSTYHAYAGRIVAEHGLRFGIESQATVLSVAACWQIAYEVVHSSSADMTIMEMAESTVVQAVLDLASELSEHLVDPQEVHEWLLDRARLAEELPGKDGKAPTKSGPDLALLLRRKALVLPLVTAYRAAKQARSAVDFGDQMALAARLARDVPAVGVSERSRYRAVLLDEFQDTSEAQMVLLSSLYAGLSADRFGGRVPVMAVGDPHQSIYAWRGASATTLNTFPVRFGPGGRGAEKAAPIRSLSTSWRNSRAVLDVANAVASPLRRGSPVTVKKVSPAPSAPAGTVQAARSITHRDEAAHVASWIAARWFDEDGDWTGHSAAVLCRNRAQFDTVVSALRAEHLPVEVVGLGGLLNAPELVDLVALLWAVQDPGRGDQVVRLLSGPVCRLGAADLSALWAWARHLVADFPDESATLGEALDHPPRFGWSSPQGATLSQAGWHRVTHLSAVIASLRTVVGIPLADLMVETERSIGLDIEVAADPDVPQGWARGHLDALIEVAGAFEASADRPSLGGFLAWLEAARAHERALEDVEIPELAEVSVHAGSVQVLTIHAAKGLEWDVVAVPGLAEGIFPVVRGQPRLAEDTWVHTPNAVKGWLTGIGSLPYPLRGDVEGLPALDLTAVDSTHGLTAAQREFSEDGVEHRVAEERRLAYVAFTRARKEMLLSAPVWSTGKRPRVTSRFLKEVLADDGPGATCEVEVGQWADMPADEQQQNPLAALEEGAPWPVEAGPRRAAMTDIVQTVLDAREASLPSATSRSDSSAPTPARTTHHLVDRAVDSRDADSLDDDRPLEIGGLLRLLLAERDEHSARAVGDRGASATAMPSQLSTTSVLDVMADRELFLRRLRRPMPAPPAPRAELGTAFHSWVEQHYGRPALLDVDLGLGVGLGGSVDPRLGKDYGPGSVPDSDAGPGPGSPTTPELSLADLQARFLDSEWAARSPVGLEIAVSTTLAGLTVRGRIDAVFPRVDDGFTVVDWKTGRPPTGQRERDRRGIQLAVYRIAYARLVGVDLSAVDTAFFYAATGETVRPPTLTEAEVEERLRRGLQGASRGG